MKLDDWRWRMGNLYSCKREGSGEPIPFRMREEQDMVLTKLHERPAVPLYIIKARRLGLSTGIGIGMQDFGAWNGGSQCKLIERSKELAGEKMRDIMRFAFDSMPKELRERFDVAHTSSPGLLDPKVAGLDEAYRSAIQAGMSARGGDCAWLWVSEWGPIAHLDAKRSMEIRTGAFPAARKGRRVVETTWMGGRGGDLWDLIKPIMEQDSSAVGEVLFFPWHGDATCVMLDGGAVSREHEDYFTSLGERLGKQFSREQKRWYVVTQSEQGIFMKREYPSTLDEAFSAPVEGAIYAEQLSRARTEGRIVQRLPMADALVHTFWDLGAPHNAPCWFAQMVGNEVRVIDFDVGELGETITQRVARILSKGYSLGSHFLPHDAAQTERTGQTFAGAVKEAGLSNVKIVPPTRDIWIGINAVLGLFPSFVFIEPATRKGIESLEAYHTKSVSSSGIQSNEPVHDWSSHACDALRTMGEAVKAGLLKLSSIAQDRDQWTRSRTVQRRAIMRVGG